MTNAATSAPPFGKEILKALQQVDRCGAFCTSGDMPLVMPGLEVANVGTIRLPLGKTQAAKLIRQCTQAPYGKGVETLVDTSVRCVWELDPKRFSLTNPQWNESIAKLVGDVEKALGLGDARLTPHLYKLLVYEKGSFFKPHRDGEKLDGMVATFVVALPAVHRGGELVVENEGQRHEIHFAGAASGHSLSFAAFYADCEHEVLPVSDGYRLCLVYNLTLTPARGKKTPRAPRTGQAVSKIASLLSNWPIGQQPVKLAITLDHRYSQQGLTLDALKGVDGSRANVLFEAAEQAGCLAHLALLTHWQSGSAEGGDYYGRYRNRRGRNRYRSWSYDDEDDDESASGEGTGYEMGEIYDHGLSVNDWSDRDGKKPAFGHMRLEEDEIVSAVPLDAWEVSREEFEGFTGNAGMTLERWYHRAAVVIWPRHNRFTVLCGAGTDAAIAGLETMVQQAKRARESEQAEARRDCLSFAKAILDDWQKSGGNRHFSMYDYSSYAPLRDKPDRSRVAGLLVDLDSPELMSRYIGHVMPGEPSLKLDRSFVAFGKQHGWSTFASALESLWDESTATTIGRNADLLALLCTKPDKDAERIDLCQRLAERAVDAVERLDGSTQVHDWRLRELDRAALLATLVKALVSVGADEPARRLVDHAALDEARYDLTEAHLKAVFSLEAWLSKHAERSLDAVASWVSYCRRELELRTASAPRAPTDFRREANWKCSCGICRELRQFLADPTASERGFPLAKDRRAHLHQVIDANRLDVTHETKRTGRPFTLVCKKSTASFDRAYEEFTRNRKSLKRICDLEKKLVASAAQGR